MGNIQLNLNGNGQISTFGAGSDLFLAPDSIQISPKIENLIYLFDPLYYQGYSKIGEANILGTDESVNSIAALDKIFYRYPNIIPSDKYVISRGRIMNKHDDPENLYRKGNKNGSFFSYEKSNNNLDIPIYNRPYTQINKENGVKERTKALLLLRDPSSGTFRMFDENKSKTFSCFIKLNDPVKHRTDEGRVIREKKGIFLNTKYFTIGYRSPHYRRKSNPFSLNWIVNYKYKFEPFSFVFSLQDGSRNHTFMTDYSFEFDKTYHLSISIDCGTAIGDLIPAYIKVYINGEPVETANLDFNPLIKGNYSPGGNGSRRRDSRNDFSPIQPGFKRKNGQTYANNYFHNINFLGPITSERFGPPNNLYLGKSNVRFSTRKYALRQYSNTEGHTKRFLNNIDIGVIHIYNTVLSDQEILQIYKNFSNRY